MNLVSTLWSSLSDMETVDEQINSCNNDSTQLRTGKSAAQGNKGDERFKRRDPTEIRPGKALLRQGPEGRHAN